MSHFMEDKEREIVNPHMKPFMGKNMTNQARIERIEHILSQMIADVAELQDKVIQLDKPSQPVRRRSR